jgi:hypothetical protein
MHLGRINVSKLTFGLITAQIPVHHAFLPVPDKLTQAKRLSSRRVVGRHRVCGRTLAWAGRVRRG